MIYFISEAFQIVYNLFLEKNFMGATRAIRKFAKKQHYKCKQKEFKLEKEKASIANQHHRVKNKKTLCSMEIMRTYNRLINAFDH